MWPCPTENWQFPVLHPSRHSCSEPPCIYTTVCRCVITFLWQFPRNGTTGPKDMYTKCFKWLLNFPHQEGCAATLYTYVQYIYTYTIYTVHSVYIHILHSTVYTGCTYIYAIHTYIPPHVSANTGSYQSFSFLPIWKVKNGVSFLFY